VILWMVTFSPHCRSALAEDAPPPAGFNQRLNDFLGSEGGVQVYKDDQGNVGTIIDPPGGERRMTVQPPQSPSLNVGPPLQLHDPRSRDVEASGPADRTAPDFPQKAR